MLQWLTDLFTGLGGPFIAAAAALIGVWVGDKRAYRMEAWKRADDLNYLVAEVMAQLHSFAEGCLLVARDSGEARESGEYSPTEAYPKFDRESIVVEWKLLPFKLQQSLRMLALRQVQMNHDIRVCFDHEWDPPEHGKYFRLRRKKYIDLGLAVVDAMKQLEALVGDSGGDDLLKEVEGSLQEASATLSSECKAIEKRIASNKARQAKALA